MKKALVLTVIAVVIEFISAFSIAEALTLKRIQFAKGRNTAIVRGTTVKFASHLFFGQSRARNLCLTYFRRRALA